jgi:hypothetical protein
MQPYQEASQAIRKQGEMPLNVGKEAAFTAASIYGGGAVLKRVLPFLSKYIPQDLAIRGLNKIDPRFGKFIDTALNAGKTFEEAKDFIKKKAESSPEEESEKTRTESLKKFNEKKEPEKKELAKESAGKTDHWFKQQLRYLKNGSAKNTKDPFLSYAQQYYDGGVIEDEEDLKSLYDDFIKKQSGQQKKPSVGISQGLQEQFNQGYGAQGQAQPQQPRQQQAQPQQAAGPGQQALMAILQKINQGKGQP